MNRSQLLVARISEKVDPSPADPKRVEIEHDGAQRKHDSRIEHRGFAPAAHAPIEKADELDAYVQKYADTIGENAPLTIATAKFTVGEVVKDESRRDLAKCAAMVKQCFESADYTEGRRAFMEKRKPVFTGK